MADTKISALTAATAGAAANEFPINEAGTSKKLTLTQIATYLQSVGMPIVARLASDHAISATTATKVTLGATALVAGTYVFKYSLIVQAATATVSPTYGINFTGTAAVRKMTLIYVDTGGLATGLGTADDVGTSAGSMMSGTTVTAFSTTAPNMAHNGGVGTINADVFVTIEGIMIVTASGDLELWHGSETATSTTIKAGSSLVVNRTA